MSYKNIGVFAGTLLPGDFESPPAQAAPPPESSELHRGFLAELFVRLGRLKRASPVVFFSGADRGEIEAMLPAGTRIVPHEGESPGDRLVNALRVLMDGKHTPVCVVGSNSPDLPLAYVKRAFVQLKHKDAVLGPTLDGGCYLVGVRTLEPELFRGIARDGRGAFRAVLQRVERLGLSCGVLPPWYGVDDDESLSLLETMLLARKVAKGERLFRLERAIEELRLGARGR